MDDELAAVEHEGMHVRGKVVLARSLRCRSVPRCDCPGRAQCAAKRVAPRNPPAHRPARIAPRASHPSIYHVSNSTVDVTTGSTYAIVYGDNNVITTGGGGSCVIDIYGSNNLIHSLGGGSNIFNILEGDNNSVDFTLCGGCNSVYFDQGSLTVKIQGCGWGGNNVNGKPAENMTYSL
jgi:hypothetical protein